MLPRLSLLLLIPLFLAEPATAQPAAGNATSQSIDAGAQWALLISGRDARPGMQVAWRRWLSPHIGIGTDARWARRTTTTMFDSPAQAGPDGVRIPAMQGREERRISSYGFGAGVLARAAIGRMTLIGGAGPGIFLDRSTHDTTINAFQHAGSSTVRSIGLYLLMELEVRATSHLSGYVGIRTELRDMRYPDSSFGYPTAGVRFSF